MFSKEDIQNIYPLSAMQLGMLFNSIYHPDSLAYLEESTYRIKGELKGDILQAAMDVLFERYDILRTVFIYKTTEEPVQVVLKKRKSDVGFLDYSNSNATEKEKLLCEFNARRKQLVFDLSKDVLMRLTLIKLSPGEYELVWAYHHILMDGWCIQIIKKELLMVYNCLLHSVPVQLPAVVPYFKYIEWLKNQDKNLMLSHWSNYLKGFTEPTEIPRPTSANTTLPYEDGRVVVDFTRYHSTIQQLAVKNNVTPNTVLQTLWGILLAKYNGTNEVVFGTVVSGRPPEIPGIEQMVGLFINTVPFRMKFEERTSLDSLLKVVHADQISSTDFHHLSLAEIQAAGPLKQNLFSHIYAYENYPELEKEELDGQQLVNNSIVHIDSFERTNYPLAVVVIPGQQSLIRFMFNKNVYSVETMERLKDHFLTILDQLDQCENLLVKDIELITPGEREFVFEDFNNTRCDYSREKTIPDLLEEQVRLTPQAIALWCNNATMSYEQLNARANQLAATLQKRGVKPKDNVGLIVDRSFDMIIGMYAIMKTGAAYIPVDPHYPIDRQEYIVENSDCKVIVVDKSCPSAGKFRETHLLLTIGVEDEHEETANVSFSRCSTDLAYIIYTSGSTGKPKGVMIEHHSVVNLIEWVNRQFNVTQKDKLLFITSMCFDLAVYDVFGIHAKGGQVVIATEPQIHDLDELVRLLKDQRITFWDSVPSTMGLIVDELEELDLRIESLRLVFMSGDWIPVALPDRIVKFFPNANPISLGGATEGTIWSNFFPITRVDKSWTSIPYGRPISNNTFYILDQNEKMVPPGFPGYLYIGGVGVARGYKNDPIKTEQAFKPDPFVKDLGGMMYRTGDLGKINADGNMQFLGRVDNQVKIRGFRIEMDEVQFHILRINGIKAAATLVNDLGTEKSLASFVVLHEGILLDSNQIKESLSENLPDYMIPEQIIFLDELPLNINGKIDFKYLKTLLSSSPFTAPAIVLPTNQIEEQLLTIWKRILETKDIGVTTNFFYAGGHSIKAIQMLSRINKELKIKIELSDIFLNPTIEKLAQKIRINSRPQEHYPSPLPHAQYYELSSAQRRLWILNSFEEQEAVYKISANYQVQGDLDIDLLTLAFNQLVERHEILRTRFVTVDGKPMQKVFSLSDSGFNLEHHQFYGKEDELPVFLETRIKRRLDLEKDPLFEVVLCSLDANRYQLLITVHHIVFDGWSMDVIVHEIMNNYKSQGKERHSPLPFQYKDYAHWQNLQLKEKEFTAKQYWVSIFSDGGTTLNLPSDYNRPAVQTYKGETIFFTIDENILTKLKRISNEADATLFMTLVACVNTLFFHYTGDEDITIGVPVSGRVFPELENQIGIFVNSLPIRTHFNGTDTFPELISKVKKSLLGAMTHQDYPFDRLLNAIDISRDTSRNPLFDVMVTLHNAVKFESPVPVTSALSFSRCPANHHISQFDLSIDFHDRGNTLSGSIEFNTDIFKRQRIESMITHFQNLLNNLNDVYQLSELQFMSNQERQVVLENFNSTKFEFKEAAPYNVAFEAVAKKYPDHIAVMVNQDNITYHMLNQRANQLANMITSLQAGTGKGTVAVFMERGINQVAATLAIFKSGNRYLSLPTNNSWTRNLFMLDDCEVSLIISEVGNSDALLSETLPAGVKDIVLVESGRLDTRPRQNQQVRIWVEEDIQNQAVTDPVNVNKPGDDAYIVYTSGSTGTPKGVILGYDGLFNQIASKIKTLDLPLGFGLLQSAPLTADIAVWQTLGPLLAAGRTIIAPNEIVYSTELLFDYIKSQRCYLIELVPSVVELLIEHAGRLSDEERKLPSLKVLMITGESFSHHLVNRFMHYYPGVTIVNAYGPAEASDDVTLEIIKEPLTDSQDLLIGKPVQNMKVFIVGKGRQLLPVGVWGEIAIAGVGVGKGYWRRPELTRDKFVPNPFDDSFQTMYLTGDVARWNENGSLQFKGRIDDQVKVNGNRIELGEIENQMSKYPQLRQGVALVKKSSTGNSTLLFFYTSDVRLENSSLKSFCMSRLPLFMVPHHFVRVDKFELTLNGKINRKALLSLDVDHRDLQQPVNDRPLTPNGEILSGIWKDLFGRKDIRITNDFFDLGGDSITAIQVSSRLYQLGLSLKVRDIFLAPTMGEMASKISPLKRKAIQSVITGEIPLTPIQENFFQLHRTLIHHNNQSVVVRVSDRFSKDDYSRAFRKLAEHHDILRVVFQQEKDSYKQYQGGSPIDIKIQEHNFPNDTHRSSVVLEKCQQLQASINLSEGPLFQLAVFNLSSGHYLMIVIHHLIVDGVSWRILLEDINALLRQIKSKHELQLPLKTDSYKLWAEKLRENSKSIVSPEEQFYWTELSRTHRQTIPYDFDSTDNRICHAGRLTVTLDEKETASLLTETHRSFRTEINDILLLAWGKAINSVFSITSSVVMLEGHGREDLMEDIDLSRTVGWFTSLYPFVLETNSQHDLGSEIKMVKESLRKIPNRGSSYGVHRYLNGNHFDLSPQVSFNYLGQFESQQPEGMLVTVGSWGDEQAPESEKEHDLEILARVVESKLEIALIFNKTQFKLATIEKILDEYRRQLLVVIAFCSKTEKQQLTPSDFSFKDLSLDELDTLNSMF